MIATNYFKAGIGYLSTGTEPRSAKASAYREAIFLFDDADGIGTALAYRDARDAFDGRGHVSVWRRTVAVEGLAGAVEVVGEEPAHSPARTGTRGGHGGVMQPGQRYRDKGEVEAAE